MAYSIPEIDELLEGIKSARVEYIQNNKAPNPDRLELLDILDATSELIQELAKSEDKSNVRECCLGAYLFCMEHIAAQYRYLSPEHSEGYIYNSGSKLYKILLQKLNISAENILSDQEKLSYIVKYHQLLANNNEIFKEILTNKGRDAESANQSVLMSIQTAFRKVIVDINNLKKSIPTELYMDESLTTLLDEYLKNSKTKDRKLHAKLATALKNLIPAQQDLNESIHSLCDTQLIKMGFLLTVLQDIKNEYYLRDPKYHSELYKLCLKALNIETIEDLDPAIRNLCLTEFNLFISDYDKIKQLQTEVKKLPSEETDDNNISDVVIDMRKLSEAMREEIKNGNTSSIGSTSFILTLSLLGALVAAAPGYGAGYALGFAATQTHGAIAPKLMVEKATGTMMSIVFNTNGKHLGYFAANLIVDETLKRGFAKVLETLAILFGGITGATIGLTVVCSYEALKNLCLLCQHLANDPTLAKAADPQFLETLNNLPAEIFPEEDKQKVKKVTKGLEPPRFFVEQNAKRNLDSLLEKEIIVVDEHSRYEML